jgi:hypothetical protein
LHIGLLIRGDSGDRQIVGLGARGVAVGIGVDALDVVDVVKEFVPILGLLGCPANSMIPTYRPRSRAAITRERRRSKKAGSNRSRSTFSPPSFALPGPVRT